LEIFGGVAKSKKEEKRVWGSKGKTCWGGNTTNLKKKDCANKKRSQTTEIPKIKDPEEKNENKSWTSRGTCSKKKTDLKKKRPDGKRGWRPKAYSHRKKGGGEKKGNKN